MKVRIFLSTLIWLIHTNNVSSLDRRIYFIKLYSFFLNNFSTKVYLTSSNSINFLKYNYIINSINIFSKISSNKINILGLENDFKHFYSSKHLPSAQVEKFHSRPKFFSSNKYENLFLISSFKLYTKINIYNSSNLRVHNSYFVSYLSFRSSNVSVNSIKKFFQYYKTFFHFVSNVYYYKIPFLSFGSSAFKRELLSLNWLYLSKFTFMWHYTKPFFFFTPNKIRDEMFNLFNNYSLLNFHTAAVIDVFYHSKTIYYLHKTGFYTFGLVPTNTPKYTLNFALPTTQESILSQVFFIRFLLVSKKYTEKHIFNNLFNKWLLLKNFILK